MEYIFEYTGNGVYQVRLNGEFVMYTDVNSSKLVDDYLKEHGFVSREDFYEEAVQHNLRALGLA